MNKNLTKAELRSAALQKRIALDKKYRQDAERAAVLHLASTEEFALAEKILLYYPVRSEADPLPLFEIAKEQGKRIAFPKCNKTELTMRFFEVSSHDDLTLGAYNIPEPNDTLGELICDERTLCIVPALLYSKHGHRLGWGKGYYDRFLADFDGISVGFTYDGFVTDTLPGDEHDRALDMIVTEKGVYRCEGKNKICHRLS